MKKVTLVSGEPGAGHAPELSLGLRKYVDLTTVWWKRGHHGIDLLDPEAVYGFHNIPPEGDEIIIMSCRAYNLMRQAFRKRPGGIHGLLAGYNEVKIIITDSRFMRDPTGYNKAFKDYQVWATICKIHFRGDEPTKPYYRPFDLSHADKTKNSKLTVAHSPFVAIKRKEKGTDQIEMVMEDYPEVKFDLITGVGWYESIRRKAKAHIFVDQISHYNRANFKFLDDDYTWMALGLSGDEGMHLGCMTICYGDGSQDLGITIPPLAWCTEDNFEDTLEYFIKNPVMRQEMADKQYDFAMKYGTRDYAARNLLNML